MWDKARARACGQRILAALRAEGAVEVETDILQPADALLDLYGEDIRARAYVSADPLRGEMLLRPDFTVPVVQMHMAGGAEPARYCYFGEVFRKQEHAGPREAEYFQAGFEIFDRADPEAADAEVFAIFAGLLEPLRLVPVVGDIGLLMAAVRGLDTLEARKSALLRHIWRPSRFEALLARYGGRPPVSAGRAALLAGEQGTSRWIGMRTRAEMYARVEVLRADAAAPPLAAGEVARLAALFAVDVPASRAHGVLGDLAQDMPAIAPAVARLGRRMEALAARGVDLDALRFDASHGRTTMEYYDGFTFSFLHPDQSMPPVASGGRYDALTAVLGQGASIPAVGGVIRPALVAALEAGACDQVAAAEVSGARSGTASLCGGDASVVDGFSAGGARMPAEGLAGRSGPGVPA